MIRHAIVIAVIGVCAPILCAQAPSGSDRTAPTDRAAGFADAELDAVAEGLRAKALLTERILEGGSFSVNVRHIAGAETALVHGNIAEVWVVRDGTATLATGGSLVDPEPGSGPGDRRGSSIRGGVERLLKAGDIVFIPPGVPHGIKESASVTYLNIRFETK